MHTLVSSGNVQSRIIAGNFLSVVAHEDQVCAANWTETNKVFVCKHNGSSWVKVHSFNVDLKGLITLSVKNNQIKCCSAYNDKIAVYSLSGELLQTFGSHGRGDAGQVNSPYIYDDDDDGSVLIADRNNDRLQVMSEQGEFSVLQLEPPVTRPIRAELCNNRLYVLSNSWWVRGTVHKYI